MSEPIQDGVALFGTVTSIYQAGGGRRKVTVRAANGDEHATVTYMCWAGREPRVGDKATISLAVTHDSAPQPTPRRCERCGQSETGRPALITEDGVTLCQRCVDELDAEHEMRQGL